MIKSLIKRPKPQLKKTAGDIKLPAWQTLKSEEIENLVVKLAKEGNTSAKIGLILRDQYAVGNVKNATGKIILEIIKEHGLKPTIPEDLKALIKRAVNAAAHVEKNSKDFQNIRGLTIVEARIKKLVKYYKKEGILPKDWKYSLENAKMIIE